MPYRQAVSVNESIKRGNQSGRNFMEPASSDLNDLLLLVVTGLNWLNTVISGALKAQVFLKPPIKGGESSAGERVQLWHQWDEPVESVALAAGAQGYVADTSTGFCRD